MNETIKSIYERRAVRKYKDKPIPKKAIEEIIGAARMSPSAMNKQPLKFYVVTDKELIKLFSEDIEKTIGNDFPHLKQRKESMKMGDVIFYGAPAVIFITSPKDNKLADLDTGICAQTIMLAAKSLGLDSCPVGMARFIEQTKSYSKLNIPPSEQIKLTVILGYGDENPEPKERIKNNAFFV